jgi:lipopolysaccharide export system protein LptA
MIRALFAGAVLVPALMVAAIAQDNIGLGLGEGDGKSLPVNITADNGVEWRQAEQVYIARGNVKAVRGTVTVYADEMRAYYRPVTKPGAAKPTPAPAPKPAAAAKPEKPGSETQDQGPTEIYRLEASGNVRFATDTQTAYGDHAVYTVDDTMLVMTGEHLKMVTPRDTLTARDSFEWYDAKQFGVARGDAVDLHEGKRIAADVLTATVVHPPGQEQHIDRIDATGDVLVTSNDQIGRGDNGVYNAESGIVTLAGNVRLTRGQNQMNGEYGVVDLNRNVGHLLPAPPGTRLASGAKTRVSGLLMPDQKGAGLGRPGVPSKPGAAKTKGGAKPKPAGAKQQNGATQP